VNQLHSIDFTQLKIVQFSLTLKIESVKTTSFFDTFQVFPVGAASGAQAKSPSNALRKATREGKQGSIAKRWSRRTGAQVKGRIESRGVGLVCPVGGEPGARAMIARFNPAKGRDESRSARV